MLTPPFGRQTGAVSEFSSVSFLVDFLLSGVPPSADRLYRATWRHVSCCLQCASYNVSKKKQQTEKQILTRRGSPFCLPVRHLSTRTESCHVSVSVYLWPHRCMDHVKKVERGKPVNHSPAIIYLVVENVKFGDSNETSLFSMFEEQNIILNIKTLSVSACQLALDIPNSLQHLKATQR